uniref:Receptor kinase-like protein Xa21 n=1 Tax=Oryza meridionalis TaxID=40149 RepID=A0A0E0E8Y0_9ORYZ
MLILFALLLFSYGVGNIRCATKAIESDPTGFLKNWNGSTPFCKWAGGRHIRNHSGRVVALELPGLRLSGQISPSVGNLTFLKRLDLSSNSLSGLLPPLNRLHRLQVLDLSSNSLQDIIPDTFANCSNLAKLNLSYNSLVGEIPLKLGFLSNLEILVLSKNNFTGTIPPIFSNISRMQTLVLSYNQLSGCIPDDLGKLSNLQLLALGGNNLSGGFPQALFNLSNSRNNLQSICTWWDLDGPPRNMYSKQPVKLVMFIQLGLFLLLLCGVGNVHCSTVHENRIDLQSLLDFKKGITEDPNKALLSWNISTHFCRWNGVTCTTSRPLRVSELNLTTQSLAGEITSSLANLTSLRKLDLSYNRLFGQFRLLNPLQQLDTLYMNDNSLDGIIPDTLTNSTKLINIDLSDNQFRGAIPPKIGSLTNLEYLYLGHNSLTGTIPANVGNLTKLNTLSFKDNQLEGNIPDGVWQLSNLTLLVLGQNRLSGGIPQALNLPLLVALGLEENMLGQVLPPNIGYALPSLQVISLYSNKFEGHIPASIGNVLGLQLIDFSANNFTGQIPTSIGRLSQLGKLNLEKNQLEASDDQGWEFLYELRNCMSLQVLSLAYNNLQGSILTFRIVPASIGNLRNLTKLGLEQNNFNGAIGEWIGELKNLQGLNLGRNTFVGPIPPSIGNLTQLTELLLDTNKFEGPIPPSLGHLKLSKLNLSYNKLQGSLPQEVGNLQNLNELYLSANNFSGVIPDTLGQCRHLITIQMDQNFLTGDIPASLGNILSLNWLNLSHNNLSGTIPESLNRLPALTILDLSYNDLQGEIPRNFLFQNATVLLEGNNGLCGGARNLRLPSCPVLSQRTARRVNLIKILIPIFGFMSLLLLVYFLLVEKKAKRAYSSLNYIGENFPKVSYNDLAQATSNFSSSNLIGRGSYGSVYRGKLKESKTDVAVKVFDLEMRGAERSFMSECEALRSIQHRNLLPILTACLTVDNDGNVFKALVYEFMPNGSLDGWLHQKGELKSPKHLGLGQRISIAVNIADALDYLHHDCGRPTIHCDLKPSNILLNDDMTALLGDFGIARFYVDSRSPPTGSISSIGVNGTIGYIAPEFAGGGRPSTSGDAYSFGIVLLEMMTGKRPTDPMFKDCLDIVTFVKSNVPHQILNVIDAHITEECKELAEGKKVSEPAVIQSVVLPLLEVALSCTRTIPSERANMKQTASKMHAIETSYLGWSAKKNTH